jgi:chromosome segregation ATPase
MIFRLIASVFHLLAVVVRREAEIDSLKERMEKVEKELRVQKEKGREAHRSLMVLEIQRESDKDRIAALEKSFAERREFDSEIRDTQNRHLTALTRHLESHAKQLDILDNKVSIPFSQIPPINPTDN